MFKIFMKLFMSREMLFELMTYRASSTKGFPIEKKVYIYEVCQAKVAALVLTDEVDFAPFMPCRLAVYEDGSKVVISTQNMEMMLDALKNNKELFTQTSELFDTLKSLMNDIK